MNQDTVQGNWQQLSGKIKQKWGKLTDDDLTRAKGDKEYLVGKLHEQYGIAKDRAEDELQTLGYREDDQDADLRSSHRSAGGRMDASGQSGNSRQDLEGSAGHTLEAGSQRGSSSGRGNESKSGSMADKSNPQKSSPGSGSNR
jgi:uncharacterized protein YjbJ (UPF0337 family)